MVCVILRRKAPANLCMYVSIRFASLYCPLYEMSYLPRDGVFPPLNEMSRAIRTVGHSPQRVKGVAHGEGYNCNRGYIDLFSSS